MVVKALMLIEVFAYLKLMIILPFEIHIVRMIHDLLHLIRSISTTCFMDNLPHIMLLYIVFDLKHCILVISLKIRARSYDRIISGFNIFIYFLCLVASLFYLLFFSFGL